MVTQTTSEFKLDAVCLLTVNPVVKDKLTAEMSEQSANPAIEGCVLTSLAQLSKRRCRSLIAQIEGLKHWLSAGEGIGFGAFS